MAATAQLQAAVEEAHQFASNVFNALICLDLGHDTRKTGEELLEACKRNSEYPAALLSIVSPQYPLPVPQGVSAYNVSFLAFIELKNYVKLNWGEVTPPNRAVIKRALADLLPSQLPTKLGKQVATTCALVVEHETTYSELRVAWPQLALSLKQAFVTKTSPITAGYALHNISRALRDARNFDSVNNEDVDKDLARRAPKKDRLGDDAAFFASQVLAEAFQMWGELTQEALSLVSTLPADPNAAVDENAIKAINDVLSACETTLDGIRSCLAVTLPRLYDAAVEPAPQTGMSVAVAWTTFFGLLFDSLRQYMMAYGYVGHYSPVAQYLSSVMISGIRLIEKSREAYPFRLAPLMSPFVAVAMDILTKRATPNPDMDVVVNLMGVLYKILNEDDYQIPGRQLTLPDNFLNDVWTTCTHYIGWDTGNLKHWSDDPEGFCDWWDDLDPQVDGIPAAEKLARLSLNMYPEMLSAVQATLDAASSGFNPNDVASVLQKDTAYSLFQVSYSAFSERGVSMVEWFTSHARGDVQLLTQSSNMAIIGARIAVIIASVFTPGNAEPNTRTTAYAILADICRCQDLVVLYRASTAIRAAAKDADRNDEAFVPLLPVFVNAMVHLCLSFSDAELVCDVLHELRSVVRHLDLLIDSVSQMILDLIIGLFNNNAEQAIQVSALDVLTALISALPADSERWQASLTPIILTNSQNLGKESAQLIAHGYLDVWHTLLINSEVATGYLAQLAPAIQVYAEWAVKLEEDEWIAMLGSLIRSYMLLDHGCAESFAPVFKSAIQSMLAFAGSQLNELKAPTHDFIPRVVASFANNATVQACASLDLALQVHANAASIYSDELGLTLQIASVLSGTKQFLKDHAVWGVYTALITTLSRVVVNNIGFLQQGNLSNDVQNITPVLIHPTTFAALRHEFPDEYQARVIAMAILGLCPHVALSGGGELVKKAVSVVVRIHDDLYTAFEDETLFSAMADDYTHCAEVARRAQVTSADATNSANIQDFCRDQLTSFANTPVGAELYQYYQQLILNQQAVLDG